MPPHTPATLAHLFAAERALGRLDEALRAPDRHRSHLADAARREALAAARLDDHPVHPGDFFMALVAPTLVPLGGRADATYAHGFWQLAEALQGVIVQAWPAPAGPARMLRATIAAPDAAGAALASAWAALAEGEALLRGAGASDIEPAIENAEGWEPAAPLPAPWTIPWLAEILRRLLHGADAETPEAELEPLAQAAAEILGDLDEALRRQPGLPGLAAALGVLHSRAEPFPKGTRMEGDRRLAPVWEVVDARAATPFGWKLARVLAPPLLARVSDLNAAWVPFSPAFAVDVASYRRAAAGGDKARWSAWFAAAVASAATREHQRVLALDRIGERWHGLIGERRSHSRLASMPELLFERPAFTVRSLQQRLSCTFRGAQLIARALERAGIVREISERALDRVYVAQDLLPPANYVGGGWRAS